MDTRSAQIRRKLGHPVIDVDGHWLEPVPVFEEYLDATGRARAVDVFRQWCRARSEHYGLEPAERQRRRLPRTNWWATSNKAIDRATSLAPRLLHERLGDFGIDFSVIYPTLGLLGQDIADPEFRHWFCRASNLMAAESFAPYKDRVTPVALIPTAAPLEAVEELTFCVRELGMKAAMISATPRRTIEADEAWQPDASRRRSYVDTIGLDSPYDYEPLWRAFLELGVAVTTHGGSKGWPDRLSTSSHVVNHLGHFAQANHLAARTIFMGGVTHRYPQLNFAFLEGGMGWAGNLFFDLIGHWKKLNRGAMDRNLRPDLLNVTELRRLLTSYGDERLSRNLDALVEKNLDSHEPYVTTAESIRRNIEEDEFRHVPISSPRDIERLFAQPFYFGCESDDPMTAWAYCKPLENRLKPVFSSDISHFDVTDMTEVLEEAFELVEDGLLDEEAFGEFTFTNAVKLHTKLNPNFFKGTCVEAAASAVLDAESSPQQASRRASVA